MFFFLCEKDYTHYQTQAEYTDTITVIMIHLELDHFAPAFVVQVSNRAVHQLVGGPLQGHEVSILVHREVTWDSLHVIPLKQPWMLGLVSIHYS